MKRIDYRALPDEAFVSRLQAEAWFLYVQNLPVTSSHLEQLACRGVGPRYTKIAGRIMYKITWLKAWLDSEVKYRMRRPKQARSRPEKDLSGSRM